MTGVTVDDRRIAIIGMAFRFPGATTAEQYWRMIRDGTSRVHRFTAQELGDDGLAGASGLLDDLAGFDAEFFGIAPREAELMDPQHRLFLETCFHALEDAGQVEVADGTRVGVFAGQGYHLYPLQNYLLNNVHPTQTADTWPGLVQFGVGSYPDFIATRTAFRLGLTGPAVTVLSACSTSLVAVHTAVQSLLAGDSHVAVAGAAAVHVPQVVGYRSFKGTVLSPSGVCRAFDARSDGTVGGNGVAAVVLKRLDQAIADRDRIHAVILGSAVNNDGATKAAYAAPSGVGQTRVALRALEVADVPPHTIGYLEAHGTGTYKGDPIEFAAMTAAYGGSASQTGHCALGSVKPNIGHLDACAGMASLIKAVLVLRHAEIPPLAGFTAPNPALALDDSPFRLPAAVEPWPGGAPRRAAVNCLGVGGTNAHLVLEQAPTLPAQPRSAEPRLILPLSARSPQALDELTAAIRALIGTVDLGDLIRTVAVGRGQHRHRLVALGRTANELAASLAAPVHTGTVAVPPGDLWPAPVGSYPADDAELAALWCGGADVDWAAVLDGRGGERVDLPSYPFQRHGHWVGPEARIVNAKENTMQRILDRVCELTSRHLGLPVADVGADTAFPDLGADSLSIVNMVRELEEEYGIRIAVRELFEDTDSPRRLAELVASRVGHDTVPPQPVVPQVPPPASVAPPEPIVAEPDVVTHDVEPTELQRDLAALADKLGTVARLQLDLMADFSRLVDRHTAGGAR